MASFRVQRRLGLIRAEDGFPGVIGGRMLVGSLRKRLSEGGIVLPKLSIIVPVFNEKYRLDKCLMSLKNQLMRNIEIILVDDGSNDGSAGLCDQAASLDERIKVLHMSNKGSTAARKAGMKLATGKYVTFVDADDWIEQDLCACLYEKAEESEAELIIGGHFLDTAGEVRRQISTLNASFYDRKALEIQVFPQLFHNDFYSGWSIYPFLCGKLFLREKLLPYMERVEDSIALGDDVCVTFPYLLSCKSIVMVDNPLYHYVQRVDSQSHARLSHENLGSMRSIYKLVLESLHQQGLEETYAGKFRLYMLTTMLIPRFPWLLGKYLYHESEMPFLKLRRGSKVIIYGAGVFGRALHDFLTESRFAEVVLWLDARAEQLRKAGYEIKALQEVEKWPDYDCVVVPIMNREVVKAVCRNLLAAGIEDGCIRYLDEKYVNSADAWQMFGMENERS